MTGSTGSLSLGKIRQIAINVHDLERATAFYRDTLGMKLLFEVPNLAFFDAGGVRLMLGKGETPEIDHPGSILYYLVPDIQAAHATLVSKGVQVLREPAFIAPMPDHDLWISDYKDSEDNMFALMSEAPRV
jgi:predicted enzyme related to lactoylglutathione lyase